MVSLVKNSTKKGAKIQNEYMFLLRCIMASSWIQNLYFKTKPKTSALVAKAKFCKYFIPLLEDKKVPKLSYL